MSSRLKPTLVKSLWGAITLCVGSAVASPSPHEGHAVAAARVSAPVMERARRGEIQEVLVELRRPEGVDPRALQPWQAAIRRRQDEVARCAGLEPRHRLRDWSSIPMLFLRIEPAMLSRLSTCPAVVAVGENRLNRAALVQSLPLIDAEVARQESGFTGEGGAVAILDSGIDYHQEELGGCFGEGCKVVGGYDFGDGDDDPMDCGIHHGTNVAAIAAGTRGVAPGARVVALKVFSDEDCSTASDATVAGALDWLVAHRAEFDIKAVNISLGNYRGGYGSPCDRIDGYGPAIETVHDAGVLVVAAAGNEAKPDRVDYPACHTKALAVANSYDDYFEAICWGNATCSSGLCADYDVGPDTIACSSDGGVMIDVAAPGTFIDAGGISLAGTSQAAPHVTGAAAVLAEAYPDASVDALWAALKASSDTVVDDRVAPGYLYPRLNLVDALDAFEDGDGDGYPRSTDCVDTDGEIHPGAVERCNSLDDDCDGVGDDAMQVDSDHDGYTGCNGDCDDSNPSIHPEGIEVGDRKDNDCDGEIDEGVPVDNPDDEGDGGCGCTVSRGGVGVGQGESRRGEGGLEGGVLLIAGLIVRRARRAGATTPCDDYFPAGVK